MRGSYGESKGFHYAGKIFPFWNWNKPEICFVKWNFSNLRYVTQKFFRFPENFLFLFRIPEKKISRSVHHWGHVSSVQPF